MKKTYSNALLQGIVAIFAASLIGCGGGSGNSNDASVTCPAGMVKIKKAADGVGETCTVPTDTNTSTDTGTGTGGTAGTGGTTVVGGTGGTSTASSTSTNTWQPNQYCGTIQLLSDAESSMQLGLWPVGNWNICITGAMSDTDHTDISVVGYGYIASELASHNTQDNLPPSLVRYTGVMGKKCVLVTPVTVTSNGPDLQGNGVVGSGVATGFTICDGTTTVTWGGPITASTCPFDYTLLPL